MIRIFLNGLAASAGGGLTYLRNVIPHLAHCDVQTTVALSREQSSEFASTGNVAVLPMSTPHNALHRFWFEQRKLPGFIRSSRSDVLISAGNFALRNSPVPQMLLSRNSLYTSTDFLADLRRRRDYLLWAETRAKAVLALRSIHWADRTVTPSRAFAEVLSRWSHREVLAVHHGFDRQRFVEERTPLSSQVQHELDQANDALRLLFVSHYNYYRNFETLLRALPLIQKRVTKPVKLFLTCRLRPAQNPGSYRPDSAASLIERLQIRRNVVELGSVPYRSLHHLYSACNIYVSPAYAESFSHTLIEAMASGLPVVASDLPVHREICAEAGSYFDRFSAEQLADCVVRVAEDSSWAQALVARGQRRVHDFSWKQHLDNIIGLAAELSRTQQARQGVAA